MIKTFGLPSCIPSVIALQLFVLYMYTIDLMAS